MSARNGRLYITGGWSDPNNYFTPSDTVDVYDIATDTWATAPHMLYTRYGQAQGTLDDGRIIVTTGITGVGYRGRFTEVLAPGEPCLPSPTPTGAATGTTTATPAATNSPTASNTAPPNTPTSTGTQVPLTATPTATVTLVPVTSTPTPPPSATPRATVTGTPCAINFTDVHETDYFYADVRCVYCLGAVSGYSDGTFRPYNNTTRGQMTKIIVLALSIPIVTPTGNPTFNDVPADSTFYSYVETAAADNIVSGYSDGTFRPNNNVTRGQLSKIVVIAAGHVYSWPILDPAEPPSAMCPLAAPSSRM